LLNKNFSIKRRAGGVGMFVYMETALHVNRRALGGICRVQSLRFISYKLLKKLGLNSDIGWSMLLMYMPIGWRRLPLLEQMSLVFIGYL
jgi:hypothetical protein